MEKNEFEANLNQLERKIKKYDSYNERYWNNRITAEICKKVISTHIKKIIIDSKTAELTSKYEQLLSNLEDEVYKDIKNETDPEIAYQNLMFHIILSDKEQQFIDEMGCFSTKNIKEFSNKKETSDSKLYNLINAVQILDDIKGYEKRKIEILSDIIDNVLDEDILRIYKRIRLDNENKQKRKPQTFEDNFTYHRNNLNIVEDFAYNKILDEDVYTYLVEMVNIVFKYNTHGPAKLNIEKSKEKQLIKKI